MDIWRLQGWVRSTFIGGEGHTCFPIVVLPLKAAERVSCIQVSLPHFSHVRGQCVEVPLGKIVSSTSVISMDAGGEGPYHLVEKGALKDELRAAREPAAAKSGGLFRAKSINISPLNNLCQAVMLQITQC